LRQKDLKETKEDLKEENDAYAAAVIAYNNWIAENNREVKVL
jgi:hypothetical protein